MLGPKGFQVLPYYNPNSQNLHRKLERTLSNCYPQLSITLINKNNFSIASLFPRKEFLPQSVRSSAIYKYECSSCNASYIGCTSRHYETRISEHLGVSSRTKRPLTQPPFSSIRNHSNSTGHILSTDAFSILAQCSNIDLHILESIYIRIMKPSLNEMSSSFPLLVTPS